MRKWDWNERHFDRNDGRLIETHQKYPEDNANYRAEGSGKDS